MPRGVTLWFWAGAFERWVGTPPREWVRSRRDGRRHVHRHERRKVICHEPHGWRDVTFEAKQASGLNFTHTGLRRAFPDPLPAGTALPDAVRCTQNGSQQGDAMCERCRARPPASGSNLCQQCRDAL